MYGVIRRVIHDTKGLYSQGDITDRPCPAITIGVGGLDSSHYVVEYYITDDLPDKRERELTDKPPYQVPSMLEIAAIPWNGYNVVSTFSGCGGSCLGFRMAGFRTLWASEFIPAAQETYHANYPGVILDTRDIRQVRPEEILEAVNLKRREIDVLEGSPPCASFSTAGKREKGWGQVKTYSDTKQRVDDLFFEFTRILEGLQPKVFVAENVSGLVKGKAKGYFKMILAALKDCGYNVKAKVLDAQWLGVPQMRQRVIFVGVRQDLGLEPAYPAPLTYRYSVREAIPWITRAWEDTGGQWSYGEFQDQASPTVRQGGKHLYVKTETDISRFAIGKEWDNIRPGENSDRYYNLAKPHPDQPCQTICQATAGGWNPMAVASVVHPFEKRKFTIAELKRICAFPDDFILTGSYAQQWERLGRAVPPIMMRAVALTIRDEILAKI